MDIAALVEHLAYDEGLSLARFYANKYHRAHPVMPNKIMGPVKRVHSHTHHHHKSAGSGHSHPFEHVFKKHKSHHQSHSHSHSHKGDEDEMHAGIGTTLVHASTGLEPRKDMLKGPGVRIHESYVALSNTTLGAQFSQELCQIGNANSWLAVGGSNSGPFNTCHNYFDWPGQTITASTTYAAATSTSQQRIIVKSGTIICNVANLTNFPVTVKLFLLKAKKDIPNISAAIDSYSNSSLNDTWTQALKSESFGLIDETGTTKGDEIITFPYANPFTTKGVRSLYEILDVKKLEMAAAAQEVVSYNIDMNLYTDGVKLIQANKFQDAVDSNIGGLNAANCRIGLRRNGVTLFAIVQGGLVKDIGSGLPTFGKAEVGFNIVRKVNLGFVKAPFSEISTTFAQDQTAQAAVGALATIDNVDNVHTATTV